MADPRTMLRQPLMEDDCLQSEASVIAPLKSETSDVSALPRKGTMERVGSGNTRSRRGKTVLSRTSIYAGQSAAPLTTPSAEPTAPLAAASPLSPSSSADPTSPKGHASEQKWTKLRGAAKIRQMTAANASEQVGPLGSICPTGPRIYHGPRLQAFHAVRLGTGSRCHSTAALCARPEPFSHQKLLYHPALAHFLSPTRIEEPGPLCGILKKKVAFLWAAGRWAVRKPRL